MKTIAIASDHTGYNLKSYIIEYLTSKGYKYKDFGTDNSEKVVDYPDYSDKVMEFMLENSAIGILICSTGIGMSISANRYSEFRAALCTNTLMAEKSRLHNDANILVLGSEIINNETAIEIINTFLATRFEGGRHLVRINKI
jgi:ribose 5-phosphate isomerase B